MNLNRVFTAIACSAVAFLPIAVQGQEIKTLEDYLKQCVGESEAEPNPECERLREANESPVESDDEAELVTESKSGISGYAGGTLGIFFPDIDESRPIFTGDNVDLDDTAFGSSLFVGIRFNRYLATDLELSGFVGELDSDLDEDEDYTLGALFLNPRFILPLTSKQNSLSLFLSPGIGISQLVSSVEDEIDDFDRTTFIEDDVRFTWQIKGGVSVPVSSKFSILGQVRYANQTGDETVDYFGTELGVNFDF